MTSKSAILVDFDNVFSTLWGFDCEAALQFASEPGEWLDKLGRIYLTGKPRRWLVARCYLNPAGYVTMPGEAGERFYFSRYRPSLVRAGFEVIDCPALSRGGKNAADIRMVVDALDLLNQRAYLDEFVLASGDSDFTPLLQRLRAEDRRITIVSPGYLSSAYTAVADQVVDLDMLTELVGGSQPQPAPAKPAAEAAISLSPSSGQHGVVDDLPALQANFEAFIRNRYAEARGPLNMAALSGEAAHRFPGAKTSKWFGAGSFSAAISRLDLPNILFSQHYFWDGERHPAPESEGALRREPVPRPVVMLSRELDMPQIENVDWPKVFEIVADYRKSHIFNLREAIDWCAQALSDQGVSVSVRDLHYIMAAAQYGGAGLDAEVPPEAGAIGKAFLGAVLDQASSSGLALEPEAEAVVANWLGVK